MNPDRLIERKKIAPEPPHILAVGKLFDYKLRFSHFSRRNKGGVLDIVKEEKSNVYGIIYGIKEKYLNLIDLAEGFPRIYKRYKVDVKIEEIINDEFYNSEDSKVEYLTCYCYEVVNKSTKDIPPSRAYIEHVEIGRDRYGVNIEQIEKIISTIGYFGD